METLIKVSPKRLEKRGVDLAIPGLVGYRVINYTIAAPESAVTIVYLDPNEMSGRSYFCTCPQTILLFEKENRICTLFTHR